MSTGNRMRKILGSFNEYILISLFIMTIAVLSLQVFARTFLSTAFPWAEEVARYLFVYFVFGGAALGFKNGFFISVDLIAKFLPKKARFPLQLIVDLVILLFFVIVSYIGIVLFLGTAGQLTPALEFEVRYIYLAFPIFFIQMSFYAVIRVTALLKGEKA